MSAIATCEMPSEARGLAGRLEDGIHRMWLRVYYEDTDAGGVVYYANYLRYAERARTELLRLLELRLNDLMANEGVGFVVRDCKVEFRQPARLDDLLEVRTRLTSLGRAQFVMDQRILLADGERECAVMTMRMGCVNQAVRPARIPAAAIEALKPYCAELE